MTKQTLNILIGIPASGKTTFANKYLYNTVILSSDGIRDELENHTDTMLIFNTLYSRAIEHLALGRSVTIDATNVAIKKRKNIIQRFSKHVSHINAYYFNTSLRSCLMRNMKRERTVPVEIIHKMYRQLQVPTYAEGYNRVQIVQDENSFFTTVHDRYVQNIDSCMSYEEFKSVYDMDCMKAIYELGQDNPNHTFTVGRHTYHVWNYIRENYTGSEKDKMLFASIFHDTGKYFTKEFRIKEDGTTARYANFIDHENVSGQIAVNVLSRIISDTKFILDTVEIIQNHMRLLNVDTKKAHSKLKRQVGEDRYNQLVFFQEADSSAK